MRREPIAGFTLTEMMIVVALFALVMAGISRVFLDTLLQSKAGTSQATFIGWGRMAQQRILRYVEQGSALVITNSNALTIDTRLGSVQDHVYSSVSFRDDDTRLTTVTNNYLVYDPDLSVPDDEEILCRFVTPIPGEPVFSIAPTSPKSVRVRFHVGDYAAGDNSYYSTGPGYQGVEIRFSATPRNTGREWKF